MISKTPCEEIKVGSTMFSRIILWTFVLHAACTTRPLTEVVDGSVATVDLAIPDGVRLDLAVPDLAMPFPDFAQTNQDLALPDDLSPISNPDLYVAPKRIFVSSTIFSAALGGVAGADQACQNLADTAGIGGAWKAWLGDNSSTPLTRFTHSTGEYRLMNGALVASSWSALVGGQVRHALDLTEYGKTPTATSTTACGGANVWTNLHPDGSLSMPEYTCGEWTDTVGGTLSGTWDSQEFWTIFCSGGCAGESFLYCFEQ